MAGVLTAATLIALTVVVHTVGTMQWMQRLIALYTSSNGFIGRGLRFRVLITTALVLTFLHILEIMLWALCYLYIQPDASLNSLEEAFYFSAVTFTTLGYGDITLSSDWRTLSGIQAINGILLIGWSTAFMFAVLQRTWDSTPGLRSTTGSGE